MSAHPKPRQPRRRNRYRDGDLLTKAGFEAVVKRLAKGGGQAMDPARAYDATIELLVAHQKRLGHPHMNNLLEVAQHLAAQAHAFTKGATR
ncbi:hypothetical protein [Sphingomonas baiyangensis]|uniref:Uncharacterized protein n=1 Tax=Sphingomonas baiyangensis TaxID=2572576 RepID=A0A4U1L181_9SPHN|nr:hypothetical protein [Sphingomonas baiyangensis]TKD50587.1 hypothetical protein FBR43_07270 [Sphingomonas baiyangensis]